MKIYQGAHFSELLEPLVQAIQAQPPFTKIGLIVPNQQVLAWLELALSQALDTHLGVTLLSLEQLDPTRRCAYWVWPILNYLEQISPLSNPAEAGLIESTLKPDMDTEVLKAYLDSQNRTTRWQVAEQIAKLWLASDSLAGLQAQSWLKPLFRELEQQPLPPLTQAFDTTYLWGFREIPGSAERVLAKDPKHNLAFLLTPINLSERGSKLVAAEQSTILESHSFISSRHEIESCRDWLLWQLSQQADLSLDQVAIVAPAAYHPLIASIFGQEYNPRLPLHQNSRDDLLHSPLLQALFAVFRISRSRLYRSEIGDLLSQAPLRERFGLSNEDSENCLYLWEKAQIRWGQNPQTRFAQSGAAFAENAWQHGLERLVLGFAMPEAGVYQGRSPMTVIQAADWGPLSKGIHLLETLFGRFEDWQRPRTAAQWAQQLRQDLPRFLALKGHENALRQLLGVLIELEKVPFQAAFSLGWVQAWLTLRLAPIRQGFHGSAPADQITLIDSDQIIEISDIPYQLIAILGYRTEQFQPAASWLQASLNTEPFSVMHNWVWGHCQRVSTGLSPAIWLSWAGSLSDGQHLPPAPEWLSFFNAQGQPRVQVPYTADYRYGAAKPVIYLHPSDASDPIYFQPEQPLSYRPVPSKQTVAAQALPALVNEPIAEPESERPAQLDLKQLLQFWRQPLRAYLKSGLGIYLPRASQAQPKIERLEIDALERYLIREQLLDLALDRPELSQSAESLAALFEHYQAGGYLPPGALGQLHFKQLSNDWAIMQSYLSSQRPSVQQETLALSISGIDGQSMQLQGEIKLWQGALWFARPGKLRPIDKLNHWIQHLCLQIAHQQSDQTSPGPRSHLIGMESGQIQHACFEPVSQPQSYLEGLITAYLRGQTQPLPFVSECAFAYFEAQQEAQPLSEALLAAENTLTEHNSQEAAYIYRSQPWLNQDFAELAIAVFQPLNDHYHDLSQATQ